MTKSRFGARDSLSASVDPMFLSVRYRLEWGALWLLKLTANLLPESLTGPVGSLIGGAVGCIWRKRRRIARDNLARAFPGMGETEVDRLVRGTFGNLGRTAFEVLRLGRETPQRLVSRIDAEGLEHLAQAAAQGQGALLMTGHFGNWELLGAWVKASGYPLDVVVKPARNPLADRLYNALRARTGVGIIRTQVATLGIARALQAGRFVAILADQYSGEEGIEVEFFGRMVSTPRGPATLALRLGCPIITGVLIRRPRGRFTVYIDGPIIYQQTGDRERDVLAVTQEFTRRLENHIRQHPEQWLWTHRRWRD